MSLCLFLLFHTFDPILFYPNCPSIFLLSFSHFLCLSFFSISFCRVLPTPLFRSLTTSPVLSLSCSLAPPSLSHSLARSLTSFDDHSLSLLSHTLFLPPLNTTTCSNKVLILLCRYETCQFFFLKELSLRKNEKNENNQNFQFYIMFEFALII